MSARLCSSNPVFPIVYWAGIVSSGLAPPPPPKAKYCTVLRDGHGKVLLDAQRRPRYTCSPAQAAAYQRAYARWHKNVGPATTNYTRRQQIRARQLRLQQARQQALAAQQHAEAQALADQIAQLQQQMLQLASQAEQYQPDVEDSEFYDDDEEDDGFEGLFGAGVDELAGAVNDGLGSVDEEGAGAVQHHGKKHKKHGTHPGLPPHGGHPHGGHPHGAHPGHGAHPHHLTREAKQIAALKRELAHTHAAIQAGHATAYQHAMHGQLQHLIAALEKTIHVVEKENRDLEREVSPGAGKSSYDGVSGKEAPGSTAAGGGTNGGGGFGPGFKTPGPQPATVAGAGQDNLGRFHHGGHHGPGFGGMPFGSNVMPAAGFGGFGGMPFGSMVQPAYAGFGETPMPFGNFAQPMAWQDPNYDAGLMGAPAHVHTGPGCTTCGGQPAVVASPFGFGGYDAPRGGKDGTN